MADVVKQIDILNQIGIMLKAEFKSTVYSDEILEDFAKPCFFIKCLCTNIPQTKNITKKRLSIILTYFPKDIDKNEIHYADVMDRLQMLFQRGIPLKKRYIHVNEFTKCERKAPKFIYGDISSLKNNDSISLFFIVLYF